MGERRIKQFDIDGITKYYYMDEENETKEEVIKYLRMDEIQRREAKRRGKRAIRKINAQ